MGKQESITETGAPSSLFFTGWEIKALTPNTPDVFDDNSLPPSLSSLLLSSHWQRWYCCSLWFMLHTNHT